MRKIALARKAAHEVYQFKITLNDSAPRVWRRIVVPHAYSFFDLHVAIQSAMGWTDSHLHAFRHDSRSQHKAKRGGGPGTILYFSFPDPDDDMFPVSYDKKDERKEKIADYFGERFVQCTYEYDFGDGWQHTVFFERSLPASFNVTYPVCVAGASACPPEDCGGVWGYRNLQKILKNPKHPEHKAMLEWLCLDSPSDFDPTHFDPAEVEFENPRRRLREYEKGFGVRP
jgi:hypothetical protein